MKKINAEAIINEAVEFGACYIGSYAEDCAMATNKVFEKVERYAREHRLNTEYKTNENLECYLVKVAKW